LDYVGGYTALNDVSARDWQMRTSQWTLGKAVDTFLPMGPALVTADEVPDVQKVALRTFVSGELLQEGHTSLMIFPVARLIEDTSQVMTLEPGDVIATGTPAGVGMAQKPPRWLRNGDVVRVEIEGVGALENPVRV
jgi:acylpyruvate hydrolase